MSSIHEIEQEQRKSHTGLILLLVFLLAVLPLASYSAFALADVLAEQDQRAESQEAEAGSSAAEEQGAETPELSDDGIIEIDQPTELTPSEVGQGETTGKAASEEDALLPEEAKVSSESDSAVDEVLPMAEPSDIAAETAAAKARGIVLINEVNFPDPVFRKYVANKMRADEGEGVSSRDFAWEDRIWLDAEEHGIVASLEGIQFFTNLRELVCFDNALTSLDLSGCSALTMLNCCDNALTSLSLTGCSALTEIECSGNALTSLNLGGCTSLVRLACRGNDLSELDVAGCASLKYLYCDYNALTSLNVSNNAALEDLSFSANPLTTLDVSNNPALKVLTCLYSAPNGIDVSNNPALWSLNLRYSPQVTDVDVSNNPELLNLLLDGTSLASLDVSNNPKLNYLILSNTPLTELVFSNNPALRWVNCNDCALTMLDVAGCAAALQHLDCSGNQLLDVRGITSFISKGGNVNGFEGGRQFVVVPVKAFGNSAEYRSKADYALKAGSEFTSPEEGVRYIDSHFSTKALGDFDFGTGLGAYAEHFGTWENGYAYKEGEYGECTVSGTIRFTTETFDVEFMIDGATVATQNVEEGRCASSIPGPDLAKAFVFDGWYADEAYTVPFDFSTEILEATWIYGKITYIADGGEDGDNGGGGTSGGNEDDNGNNNGGGTSGGGTSGGGTTGGGMTGGTTGGGTTDGASGGIAGGTAGAGGTVAPTQQIPTGGGINYTAVLNTLPPAAELVITPIVEALESVAEAATGRNAVPNSETIFDDSTPLAQGEAWCWVHYYIFVGIALTLIYGAAVSVRRTRFTGSLNHLEAIVLGKTPDDVTAYGTNAAIQGMEL